MSPQELWTYIHVDLRSPWLLTAYKSRDHLQVLSHGAWQWEISYTPGFLLIKSVLLSSMWLLCCLLFPLFAGMVSMAEACLHVWRLKPVLLLSSVQLRFVLRFLLGILEPHPLTLSIGGAQVSCHREGNSSFGGRKEKFIVARSKWYDNHSASPILSCCVASEFANYWAKKTARLWCLRGTSGPDRKIQGSWPQGWCRWLGKQCHWRTLGRRGGIFAMRWYDRVWYLSTRWSKVVQASRNDGLDLQAVNPRALVASSSSASAAAARVIHNITTSNHFDWNTL